MQLEKSINQLIQHFYSDFICYQMQLVGHNIDYIPLPYNNKIPNSANGLFVLNNTANNNIIPIKYSIINPITKDDVLQLIINECIAYDKASSIIEIGIQNEVLIYPEILDVMPKKVLLMYYWKFNDPKYEVIDEFKTLINDFMKHKRDNLNNKKNKNDIINNYFENYSKIISNDSNNSNIIEIIKSFKLKIYKYVEAK